MSDTTTRSAVWTMFFCLNGFERNASPRGRTIAIKDIDALHRAIGEHVSRHRKALSGKELRFLRQEMLMSQATLAHLLDVSEQTVHRWEAEKTSCPRAAEALIRRLYLEHGNAADETLRDVLTPYRRPRGRVGPQAGTDLRALQRP